MKQIIMPVLPGQRRVEVKKDMHGNVLLVFGDAGARLEPRQAYDLAILLLQGVGCEIGETYKRPDDIGGGQLRAKVKIV